MKIMKKIAVFVLAVCLAVPCFGMLTYAADGTIMFTDPSTSTGEVVEVTGVVKANATIGDADVDMTYDSQFLRFKSGENVTEASAGQLKYSGKGTGNEKELRFKMEFDVLQEGTTKIEVAGYKAYLYSDETLNCQKGSSTITIAQGTNPVQNSDAPAGETTGVKVLVEGKEYTLSESFAGTDIPMGFSETKLEYEGAERRFVKHDSSETYLAYLTDANNTGKFFLYTPGNGGFTPLEIIDISDTAFIILMPEGDGVKLPKEYQKTSIVVNDQEFPAWRNAERSDYYILNAVNNQGEKVLYQYDSADGTYQRFSASEVNVQSEETSLLSRLENKLGSAMQYLMLAAVILFIVLVAAVIVLAVKLQHRNSELDELYDEFGIDLEEEEEPKKEVKKQEKKSKFKKPAVQKVPDDFEEDDFEEDGFEDDYDDDIFEDDDFEDDFDDDDFDDYDDYDDYDFEDDDFEDDVQEEAPVVKRKKREDDFDDFDLDFIDLDD